MTRRHLLATTFSISLGVLVAGCGGGGSSSGEGRGPIMRGAAAGVVYRDSAGAPGIGRIGDSLPAGATPIAGARIYLSDGEAQTRTDDLGRFRLEGIAAGLRTLRIEGTGAAPLLVPLTVIGDAVVDIGTPPVARAAALEKAKAALTAAGVADLTAVTILAPQQPLPAGVFVAPRFAAATITTSTAGARTIPSPTWFFFCDDRAGQPFAHTVRFLYVDAQTGAVEVSEHTSWPTFNAQHFYAQAERNAVSADLLQAGSFTPSAARSLPFSRRSSRLTRAEDEGKLYELFLYGFNEAPSQIDFTSIQGFGGIPAQFGKLEAVDWHALGFTESLRGKAIEAMKRLCAEAGPHDTLLLDINCHGGLDSEGRYWMWAPIGTADWTDGLGAFPNEMLRIEDLDLPACRACNLIVLAGTCHSGAWTAYARASLDLPGKTVAVFAACAADQVSWGLLKTGRGCQAMQIVRSYIGDLAAGSAYIDLVGILPQVQTIHASFMEFNILNVHPEAKPSIPEMWSRFPGEGEDCNISLTPMAAEVGTNQFVNFELKLNNRPQSAPPVRIEVTTSLGDLSTAAGAGKRLTLTQEGSIAFASSDTGEAVITAEAFEKVSGSETSIGKTTARVTVKPVIVAIAPAAATLGPGESVNLTPSVQNYKKINPSHRIEYRWSVVGSGGGTVLPATTDETTDGGIARYTAGSGSAGTDTLTLEAYLIVSGIDPVRLGMGQAAIEVKNRIFIPVAFQVHSYLQHLSSEWTGRVLYHTYAYATFKRKKNARTYRVSGTGGFRPDVYKDFTRNFPASAAGGNMDLPGPREIVSPEDEFWVVLRGGGGTIGGFKTEAEAAAERDRIKAGLEATWGTKEYTCEVFF